MSAEKETGRGSPKKKRAAALTVEQKRIITANRDKFPSILARLDGMEGTTPRQISDYLRQHPDGEKNEHEALAGHLRDYIDKFGLPSRYGGVIAYEKYLRGRG